MCYLVDIFHQCLKILIPLTTILTSFELGCILQLMMLVLLVVLFLQSKTWCILQSVVILNWNTFYAFVCLFPIYLARLYPFWVKVLCFFFLKKWCALVGLMFNVSFPFHTVQHHNLHVCRCSATICCQSQWGQWILLPSAPPPPSGFTSSPRGVVEGGHFPLKPPYQR